MPEAATAEQQEALMATMKKLESESSLLGASAHIMGIAIKATSAGATETLR